MNRLLYLMKRLALGVPVLLFGLTLTFMVLYLGPLDPVLTILGRDANPQAAHSLRVQLGIIYPNGTPVPLWDQYRIVLTDLITFNFDQASVGQGRAPMQSWVIQRGTPALDLIAARMPATLWLGFWSVLVALLFGIPLGLFAGLRANTWSDYTVSGFGIIWRAMPSFWLAVMIAGSLSAGGLLEWYRGWLVPTKVIGTPPYVYNLLLDTPFQPFAGTPILGLISIPMPNVEMMFAAFKWILPAALVLGAASMGNEIRIGRTAVLESIHSKYVETAKAKGLSKQRIIFKHVGRNAVIPLLPVIMGEFYLLIGGSVLVEKVFAINGLGNMFFRAVLGADIPLVMVLVYIFIIVQILFNITQDLLYTVIDPRITLEEAEG